MRTIEGDERAAPSHWEPVAREPARLDARAAWTRLVATWRWAAVPLGLAVGVRVFLFCFGIVAAQLVLGRGVGRLAIWNQWDSVHYLRVASTGYNYSLTTGSEVNFFPLYPLLIRAAEPLARLFGQRTSYLLAGVAISWLAFGLACIVLYRLALERFGSGVALGAVLLLSIFPFSFYFGAAFTESLYLLLAVLAFYAVEHGNWWLAGFVALFAGAVRPPGLLVGACVVLAYALNWWRTRHGLRLDVLALALTPLGTLAYFAYLGWRFGNPLAYFHSSSLGWHGGHLQTTGLLGAWFALIHLPAGLVSGRYTSVLYAVYVIILVLVLLGSVPVARLLGLPYGIFTAASVLLPVATFPSVNSMGRYASVAFPLFILLAVWLERRQVARELVIVVFAICLGLFTTLFVGGFLLA